MNFKRILALFLCAVLSLSFFSCRKVDKGDKDEGDGGKDKNDATEVIDYSAPAVWSDTTTVTHSMFIYYFNAYYRSYIEEYDSQLEAIGLDPTKSLSIQTYNKEYTWHQYFTLQVYSQLRELIALADAAKAEGMTLTEEDKKEIASQAKNYEKLAKDAGIDIDEYVEKVYGTGVTVDTMKAANELRFFANKYYEKLIASYVYTEDECEEHYFKNSDSFLHFDYIKNTVPKKDAAELKKCKDEKSFVDTLRKIITKNNFLDDYDRFADTIEQQLQRKYVRRASYNKNSDFCKWAVKSQRRPYDIYTKTESSGDVTVIMLLPTDEVNSSNGVTYRDDVPLKNVKYIYFEATDNDTDAHTKAESIYKNWQEEPTEARFDTLIEKHGGGTENDIDKGDFDKVLIDWIFDKKRQAGDVGVIDIPTGSYLIYQLPDGEPAWLTEVREDLKNAAYSEDLNKLMDAHPTEYEVEIVYNVQEIRAQKVDNSEAK